MHRVQASIGITRMTEVGLSKVNEAKRNGYWDKLSEVNDTDTMPKDFNKALR